MDNESKKRFAMGLAEGDNFSGFTFNKFGAGVILGSIAAGAVVLGYGMTALAAKVYDKYQERKLNKAKAMLFDLQHQYKDLNEESK